MHENESHLDPEIREMFEHMKRLDPEPGTCPDEESLTSYYEGGLDMEERQRMEEHLILCKKCVEDLAFLAEMDEAAIPAKESGMTKEMVQRAKDLVKPGPSPTRPSLAHRIAGWLSGFRLAPALGAVCAVLALAVFSLYLYMPGGQGPTRPFGMGLAIMAGSPAGGITRGAGKTRGDGEIGEGEALRSGQNFRIRFHVSRDAYVWVLALNSQGDLVKLFPKDGSSRFRAEAGRAYFLPAEDGWFQLDDKRGVEKIFLLASTDLMDDMDRKIDQLRRSAGQNVEGIFPGMEIRTFSFRHE